MKHIVVENEAVPQNIEELVKTIIQRVDQEVSLEIGEVFYTSFIIHY